MNEAEHISRLRAFAHWFAMNGGHMTEECKDALTLLADYDALKARLAEAERALAVAVEANAAWVMHYENLSRDMADWRAYAEYQYAKTKEHGYPVQGALDVHFAKWRMARQNAALADSAEDGMGSSDSRAPSRGTEPAGSEARNGLEVAGAIPAPCLINSASVPRCKACGGEYLQCEAEVK